MTSERQTSDPMTFFHQVDALRTDAPALAEPMERMVARLIDLGIALALYVGVTSLVFALIAEDGFTNAASDSGLGADAVVLEPGNVAESWIAGGIGLAAALGLRRRCSRRQIARQAGDEAAHRSRGGV